MRRVLQHVNFYVPLPEPSGKLSRAQLINKIIRLIGAKNYLEIGVNTKAQPGYSRDLIVAELIHGVDPNTKTDAEFHMSSDEFFSTHCNLKYDVIFVDGLHRFEQAYKDIVNALEVITESGVVVVHDTRPISFDTQTRRQGATNKWHGDVWRAIILLRLSHPDLVVLTVDTDEGCTIIFRGKGDPLPNILEDRLFEWHYFSRHYKSILNLIDEKCFEESFVNLRNQ